MKRIQLKNPYNKAFKTDSQRLAFSVCFGFSVYGTIVSVRWSRCSLLNAALGLQEETLVMRSTLYKWILDYYFKKNKLDHINNDYVQIRWESLDGAKRYCIYKLNRNGVKVRIKNRDKGIYEYRWVAYQRLAKVNSIYTANRYHFIVSERKGIIFPFIIKFLGIYNFSIKVKYGKQFKYNSKALTAKPRSEILKMLISRHLQDRNAKFQPMTIVPMYESSMWMYHPDKDTVLSQIRMYLDAFVESGELSKSDNWYRVLPKALITSEQYDLDNQRHQDNLTQAVQLKWLTAGLIFVGLTQALITYFGE
ncbi:hypothetical protein [Vibrio aestuarianus]|uniref:hypothetical protein n=1 Tax=Vibrio aestuarianus TaxID=28171 RepID=UPI00237C6085|nr:hypothetical protein [Vibrio aestuarianus]